MAEAGTWRKGRPEPAALAAPGLAAPGLASPGRAAAPARPPVVAAGVYAAVAAAGACAGLAAAAAILALAGRTLFDIAATSAQVLLVAAPLLGLLPLSAVLLLAAGRPALQPHLLRLLLVWLVLAAGVAFWLGVRPFLR